MKRFLEIGKIVAVFGLKGEVKAEYWCDSPEFFCAFDVLYFDKGETAIEVERSHPHKNVILLKLKGVDTPEQAQNLRNKVLYMDRNEVELEEGCYFVQDLIGLDVIDADDGTCYGKLTAVSATGANDVYEIKDGTHSYYIPAIPDVIIKTDIENGRMLIHKLEGLF